MFGQNIGDHIISHIRVHSDSVFVQRIQTALYLCKCTDMTHCLRGLLPGLSLANQSDTALSPGLVHKQWKSHLEVLFWLTGHYALGGSVLTDRYGTPLKPCGSSIGIRPFKDCLVLDFEAFLYGFELSRLNWLLIISTKGRSGHFPLWCKSLLVVRLNYVDWSFATILLQ